MGIIRRLLSGGGDKPKEKKPIRRSEDQLQQTRRCNSCGGYLMGNHVKNSQLICTNCGNRVHLY